MLAAALCFIMMLSMLTHKSEATVVVSTSPLTFTKRSLVRVPFSWSDFELHRLVRSERVINMGASTF